MNVNANTKIYDKIVDRAAMIRLYERRVNSKIALVIDNHEAKIQETIKSADDKNNIFSAINKQIESTLKELYNISKRSLFDLASDQISFAYQNIETVFGKIWSTEKPYKRVTEDIVLKRPVYANSTLAEGWNNIAVAERKRIESIIRKGIADNLSIADIALDVRKGNIHNITRNQARGLVITAVTHVASQADHAVYEANKHAIKGWQYVAILDSRTTRLCASRDGHIYPVDDTKHLPPAHFHCRSRTVPVFKSWDDIAKLENVAQVRKANLVGLTKDQIKYYDGQTPLRESYNDWLLRQDKLTQLKHLGDYKQVELFQSGQLTLDKFSNPEGNSIGINELRQLTSFDIPNDTKKFANAKAKLDAMQLGVTTPDEIISDKTIQKTLEDYYFLQSGELEGTLSVTNYRGTLIGSKRAVRNRVLQSPPSEAQTIFNPITGRYEDSRIYQPNPGVFNNALKLVNESETLLDRDKQFIEQFVRRMSERVGINEAAVISDNLRVIFSRYRQNKERWTNFKAVVQGQIKFDVMNISDSIETQLRKDSDVLKKLTQSNYIDSVLGPTDLQELHDNFIDNIVKRNEWEDVTAPKIARELRGVFDIEIPLKIKSRLSEDDLKQFYLKFAHRLSLADSPDRDQFAVALGRDLYNMANLNGYRRQWYELGLKILESKRVHQFYEIETFGVQKRRMKSRMSGSYFGPYYDTQAFNIRVTDPRIQDYAKLQRKIDVGLRVGVTTEKNRLVFREGYKTYFIDRGILGLEDTRIPITSTSSFGEFPEEFIDKKMVDALNWAAKSEYRIDPDFYDFIDKLLYFKDDKGKAAYYDGLNEYRQYMASRGDAYERLKAMEWLRKSGKAFSNHPFIDHRARIYDRGLIGPQSGESFRPFLNTKIEKNFSVNDFYNFQDQIGSFLGGLSDEFEGRYNSLSITGRQKVAEKWRKDLVNIGNAMIRKKPNDIRFILEHPTVHMVEGEELGKFFRFAIEQAKIDNYLSSDYSAKSLNKLSEYKTALALEQDASSSGAQIIALTTRNKQLAELSNVVPTTQKRRLYDEIAAATFDDPRFKELNKKLGLTEKDLRKAAKAQNMVTFYGAGERTGIMNVEGKLAKVLGKSSDTLVVKASDRETVLNEISARIARYEKFDPETAEELRVLRQNVKDIFNKGIDPGDDILDQLYFLEPKTRELVEKLSHSYDRVVTPDDFKGIAKIMSEQLRTQVPILKDFTRFFGRLAEDYLNNAKPSSSSFSREDIIKQTVYGSRKNGFVLPDRISEILGIRAGETLSEKFLKRFGFYKDDSTLANMLYGAKTPENRRVGAKYLGFKFITPSLPTPENLLKGQLLTETTVGEIEILKANKLPKSWTNVPWINFDGKIIEQNFTQSFEERLTYKDKEGNWVTNILQVPQKTTVTWWEELLNKDGKINDIADATKARTAYAVNGNHSNDAVIVKNFHLWGKENNIATSTIHDAFFANAADMVPARNALRKIYAKMLNRNVIEDILEEMKNRGLPKELYDKYIEEAIDIGLIPKAGRSVIGGSVIKESDILKPEDIIKEVPGDFKEDLGWYGVG